MKTPGLAAPSVSLPFSLLLFPFPDMTRRCSSLDIRLSLYTFLPLGTCDN